VSDEAVSKETKSHESKSREDQAVKNPAKVFQTTSHIVINPFYTPADLSRFDYDKELNAPGRFPFTRGVQASMYRGQLWTMRQYAGMGDAGESNRRYHYLLSHGTTGLSVAFDLPTQIGYDSDHPMAQGEVGRVGVAIDTVEDMQRLFEGIDLEKVSTSMTINSSAAVLLALYIAVARRNGFDVTKLNGTIQNDVLKEYIARGTYIFPPVPALRLITDTIAYCGEMVPQWKAISISGYHIREAGATAVQEVAFTLADGICYVQAGVDAGLDVNRIAPQLSFFFACHNNFLEEIAKFRAARRMWARIMRDRFGATAEKALMLRFHTQTGGSTLTAQQPQNNIVRTALQAMSAVLGGTQSLHTNGYDEALALPTEESARLALRTQQIIAYESGVTATVDPLAGSYYVETLTNEIEKRALEYLEQIDAMGGMLRAIESGFVQQEIQNAAYEFQKSVDSKEQVVVGVNAFQVERDAPVRLQRIDPELERRQVERLRAFRDRRDPEKALAAVRRVEERARRRDNLMPVIVEAVESDATVGEICDAMRRVFGEHKEVLVI
jgi:methylmalonyl-CoA mutase N-terminal domain/subunit